MPLRRTVRKLSSNKPIDKPMFLARAVPAIRRPSYPVIQSLIINPDSAEVGGPHAIFYPTNAFHPCLDPRIPKVGKAFAIVFVARFHGDGEAVVRFAHASKRPSG